MGAKTEKSDGAPVQMFAHRKVSLESSTGWIKRIRLVDVVTKTNGTRFLIAGEVWCSHQVLKAVKDLIHFFMSWLHYATVTKDKPVCIDSL